MFVPSGHNSHDLSSYDAEKIGKIVAHLVSTARSSFEDEVRRILDKHEKYLLQILEGQRRGLKMPLPAPIHEASSENEDQLVSIFPTSADRSSHCKFTLPPSLELFIAESADVLHEDISREPTTELALSSDANGNALHGDVNGQTSLPDGGNSRTPSKQLRRISESSKASKPDMMTPRNSVLNLVHSAGLSGLFKPKVREVKKLAWWQDLDDPNSSTVAWVYASVMNPIIFVSVILSIFSRFDPPIFDGFNGGWLGGVQIMFDILFTLEFLVRFGVAYSKLNFMLDPFNIIDFLASMPLLLLDGLDNFDVNRISTPDNNLPKQIVRGLGPVFKVCKILRRFPTFHLLVNAFADAMEALPVLMFVFGLIGLTFASLLFVVEQEHLNPSDSTAISTFQQALWLTIITMTTVGYGDFSPKTVAGRCLVGCLVVIQVLYMALPLGILGQEFTNIWKQRHRFMAMKRVRARLHTLCLGFEDIPSVFKQFSNGDGAIDFDEFQECCHALGISMKQRQLEELYRSFDDDMGGSIDALEFAAAVFPKEYQAFLEHTEQKAAKAVRKSAQQWAS